MSKASNWFRSLIPSPHSNSAQVGHLNPTACLISSIVSKQHIYSIMLWFPHAFQGKLAFASCPVSVQVNMSASLPSCCSAWTYWLTWTEFYSCSNTEKSLKKPGIWAEKRHPRNIPWECPFCRKGQAYIEHLWILERELETERKPSWSPGPGEKLQSELAMNHKTKPLETKLHYFYCTQNYF